MKVLLPLLLHQGALPLYRILQSLHCLLDFATDFQLSLLHHRPQNLLVLQLSDKRNQLPLASPVCHHED